jgi:hypothetical protein
MAKVETKDKAVSSTELIKKAEDQSISSKELGGMLSQLNSSEENEITAEYLKIEVGESVRVWFVEMTEIKSIAEDAKPGDMNPAVRLMNEDGSFAINADTVIVSTCSKLKGRTPLEIICTGTAGTKTRTYKTYKIIQLM